MEPPSATSETSTKNVLNQALPPELSDLFAAQYPGERILHALKADLRHNGRYGEHWVVHTTTRISSWEPGEQVYSLPKETVKKFHIEELFGSSRLVAETHTGLRVSLATYSRDWVAEFAWLHRVLESWLSGGELKHPEHWESGQCSECGRLLPERDGTCVDCVPRLRMLGRLVGFLRPYPRASLALIALTTIGVGATMVPPWITKMIVDRVLKENHVEELPWWALGMIAAGVVHLACRLGSGTLSNWLGGRVVTDLRTRLHGHLQQLHMGYFNRRDSGEIVGKVMHDTQELQQFLIEGLPFLFVNSFTLIAIGVVLMALDPWLALLVFLPVPMLFLGGRWFFDRLIPLFHKHGSQRGHLHSTLNESIFGIRVVKAFGREQSRSERFGRDNEKLFDVRFLLERTFLGFSEIMFWVMSFGVAGVWFFGAGRVAAGGNLSLGDLLAFVGYIWLFYGPLQWASAVLNWMTHAMAGAQRIFGILDAPVEQPDEAYRIPVTRIQGPIVFEDVRFSYEAGKEVLKGLDLEIAEGEMIGLVGKSGAGKSTIINLLSRFYHPDRGRILVGGRDVKELDLHSFRRQIGIVMQDPFLFNASIFDNIKTAKPEASFEEVEAAARAAHAHDFILEKEDGYDTIVGDRGIKLSGGEKQRLSIARAILHNPSLLILDEATSAVDTETEEKIQQAVDALVKGRTTLAIAHRLATLRNADRIFVVEDGRVMEKGTHEELLACRGTYARLVETQMQMNRRKAELVGV